MEAQKLNGLSRHVQTTGTIIVNCVHRTTLYDEKGCADNLQVVAQSQVERFASFAQIYHAELVLYHFHSLHHISQTSLKVGATVDVINFPGSNVPLTRMQF
jgi:hypothetical protein